MTFITQIRGNPIANLKTLVAEEGKSLQTIRKLLKEIEENPRYPKHSVKRRNGNLQGVDYLVWYDYMTYSDLLKEKNIRKDMPAFDPIETAKRLGWYAEDEEKAI